MHLTGERQNKNEAVMKQFLWISIAITLTLSFIIGGLGAYVRERSVDHRIEQLRILSVGKSRAEVISYLGEPDNIIQSNVKFNGIAGYTVLEYKSSGMYSRTRKTGRDDIKVIIDPDGKIASVYYTDHIWERNAYNESVQ